jgi:hypothetical protein
MLLRRRSPIFKRPSEDLSTPHEVAPSGQPVLGRPHLAGDLIHAHDHRQSRCGCMPRKASGAVTELDCPEGCLSSSIGRVEVAWIEGPQPQAHAFLGFLSRAENWGVVLARS